MEDPSHIFESDPSLRVHMSTSNQLFFFALLLASALCWALTAESGMVPGPLPLVIFGLTIWRALRAYLMSVVFYEDFIVYRSIFGIRHFLRYSSVLFQGDRGESIVIIGEDTHGKSVRIALSKGDGDIKRAIELLNKHTK